MTALDTMVSASKLLFWTVLTASITSFCSLILPLYSSLLLFFLYCSSMLSRKTRALCANSKNFHSAEQRSFAFLTRLRAAV